MRKLFWTPILVDFISLCLIWGVAKFMWTGKSQFNILLGKEMQTYTFSTGEFHDKENAFIREASERAHKNQRAHNLR